MQKLIPFILITILILTPLGNSALAQSDVRPPCTEENVNPYIILAAADMEYFGEQMTAMSNFELSASQAMQLYIQMSDKVSIYIDMGASLPTCLLPVYLNHLAVVNRYTTMTAVFTFVLADPAMVEQLAPEVERLSVELEEYATAMFLEASQLSFDVPLDDIAPEIPAPAEADPNDPHTSLLGLVYRNQTVVDENFIVYSYVTEDNAYRVTMGVLDSERTKHDYTSGIYIVDYTTTTLSNVNVEYAFSTDVSNTPAYASLAFDFQYDGQFYSGEISTNDDSPAKDTLPALLTNVIAAIQIATN